MIGLGLDGYDPDSGHEAAAAFRIQVVADEQYIPRHQHRKGQLILALHGALTCEVENAMWMVPPQLLHNGFAGRIYLAVVFPDVFPFAGNLVLGHRFIEQADPLLEQGAVILRFFQLGGRAADIVRQADDKAGISRRGAGRGAFGIDEHDVQLRIEAGQPAGKAYAGIAGADNHPVGFNVAA